MSRSPKLRPSPWDALVVLAVVFLAALCLFSAGRKETEGELTVVVSIDGREADRFLPKDLIQSPRTYTNNGYTLTVVLGVDYEGPVLDALPPSGESGIRVIAADCPTQDCVRTGLISRGGQSIVCLPARIIVQLAGGGTENGIVDAVIG